MLSREAGRRCMRGANTSPVVVTLLAIIAVALIALIVVIALKGDGQGSTSASGSSSRSGSESSNPQAKPKPKPVDTTRIQQSYMPGRTYRSHAKAVLNAMASDKDWGVVTNMSLQYAAEAEVDRTIESNDGHTIVLLQEFRRSRCVAAFTHIEGIRIELGLPAQMLLDFGGAWAGLPPGWSAIAVESANTAMDSPLAHGFFDRLAQDPNAKVKVFVDSLQGKKVRIRYVNGQGVTQVEPLGCTLNKNEEDLIRTASVISDAYVLPDPAATTWQIDAQNLLPIIDPSLRTNMSGSVTVRRGQDQGTPENPIAQIMLDSGSEVELHDVGNDSDTKARWKPSGTMLFSFKDHVVTQAALSGQFVVERHSTNHILFEARFATQPKYQISYSCEVVK